MVGGWIGASRCTVTDEVSEQANKSHKSQIIFKVNRTNPGAASRLNPACRIRGLRMIHVAIKLSCNHLPTGLASSLHTNLST